MHFKMYIRVEVYILSLGDRGKNKHIYTRRHISWERSGGVPLILYWGLFLWVKDPAHEEDHAAVIVPHQEHEGVVHLKHFVAQPTTCRRLPGRSGAAGTLLSPPRRLRHLVRSSGIIFKNS